MTVNTKIVVTIAALTVCAAFVLQTPSLVTAQQQGATAYKIGVVNRAEVFEDYQKQQDQLAGLREEVNQKQAQIDAQIEQLKTRREEYRQQMDSLSEARQRELEDQFESELQEFQMQHRVAQQEVDRKTSRIINDMRAEIDEAVGVIGAREDYHLILEADQNPQAMPAVLYYNSQLDLTQQVVEYLNARYAQQEGSN